MPIQLPLPEKVSKGTTSKTTFRVLQSSLGNGKEQRALDGVNAIRDWFNVVYGGLTLVEKDSLLSVLRSTAGVDTVLWTPNGTTTQKEFVVDEGYSWSTIGGDFYDVTFTLREVF